MILVSHGIEFERSGSCQQCGACGCDKQPCPHWYVQDGKHWCSVYDRREEMCNECGESHESCIGFPDNPWVRVARSGVCGFTFVRVDGDSMDDLPFLGGEPYQPNR